MNIGEKVRLARRQAGISQEALSEKIGVNRSYLSLVENAKSSPTFDFLEKVSDGLELPVEDLILGQDITDYLRELPEGGGFAYEGLAEFLGDREQMLLMNPSQEEIDILRQIRVSPGYKPSRKFFVQALLDFRETRTHGKRGE